MFLRPDRENPLSCNLQIMYLLKGFNWLIHVDGCNAAIKLAMAIPNSKFQSFLFFLLALTEICMGFKVHAIFIL